MTTADVRTTCALLWVVGLGACARPSPDSGGSSAPTPLDGLGPALAAIAERALPDVGDGAVMLDLATGRVLLAHHEDIVLRRPIPPGSVMKLFSAVAVQEAGIDDESVRCAGEHVAEDGVRRPCWLRDGHGEVRLRTALSSSCNVFFYTRAEALGVEVVRDVWARFLFGAPFGPDVPRARADELPPSISSSRLPDLVVGDDPTLLVTPLSLVRALSVLATGGEVVHPAMAGDGRRTRAAFAAGDLALVVEGMREATRSGTLSDVFGGLPVAAKTGTAKRLAARSTRGLVVGFFPEDAPRLAFVVVKEHGRGAKDAGPAARQLVERALVALTEGT